MSKVLEFKAKLDKYKTINPPPKDDGYPYDIGRHNFCHLIYLGKTERPGPHIFQVRGWSLGAIKLHVAAVNWTLCAGTCSLDITEETVDNWVIEEETPEARILFGDGRFGD